jgi:hypothetical protein
VAKYTLSAASAPRMSFFRPPSSLLPLPSTYLKLLSSSNKPYLIRRDPFLLHDPSLDIVHGDVLGSSNGHDPLLFPPSSLSLLPPHAERRNLPTFFPLTLSLSSLPPLLLTRSRRSCSRLPFVTPLPSFWPPSKFFLRDGTHSEILGQ